MRLTAKSVVQRCSTGGFLDDGRPRRTCPQGGTLDHGVVHDNVVYATCGDKVYSRKVKVRGANAFVAPNRASVAR